MKGIKHFENQTCIFFINCYIFMQIIDTELFDDLRKKWGKDICCILSEKVIPISGDVSHVNLGITDRELMNGMCGEIDFIINSAATTRFDERFFFSLISFSIICITFLISLSDQCIK